MNISQQNPDGSWSPAKPIGPQGWKAKLEHRLLRVHRHPARRVALLVAHLLGRWDERGLGR